MKKWPPQGLFIYLFLSLSFALPGFCDEPKNVTSHPHVKKYRSENLEVYTDVSSKKANAMLVRLESKLRAISKYWRRSLNDKIICYIADDLEKWHDEDFPHPQAKLLLKHVKGGVPRTSMSPSRRQFAYLYATSEIGIAEHELVHAYCQLAFGAWGPDWYKEGMAEMASHDTARDHSFQCSDDVLGVLKSNQSRSVLEVINAGQFTKSVSDKFSGFERHGRSDVTWSSEDVEVVRKAREFYEQSWALCHFLCNNPNYRDRFRMLGLGYLGRTRTQFSNVFRPVQDRLDFEYRFFVQHVTNGYRVDLCAWDWNEDFGPADSQQTKIKAIKAACGFQPTGVLVKNGTTYRHTAEGRWSTGGGRSSDADGDRFGQGCLEGIILKENYELSKTFLMGAQGSFRAADSGKLYVRCRDAWNQIADNRGRVKVRLQQQ